MRIKGRPIVRFYLNYAAGAVALIAFIVLTQFLDELGIREAAPIFLMIAFVAVSLCWLRMALTGCPNCGARLMRWRWSWMGIFPTRRCSSCKYDLLSP